MKQQVMMVWAMMRKDLASLWPIATAAMALLTANIALQGADLRDIPEAVRLLLPIVSWVASAFLIVAVIHADAPAGTRHEWLTRPVPPSVVVVAKACFVTAAILLPAIIGETIAGVRNGLSWSEIGAVVTAVQWNAITTVLTGCVLAAITATLLEAAIVAVAVLGIALFIVPLTMRLSGMGEELYISGASWIADGPRAVFAMLMGGAVLRLMYSRRQTRAARIAFGAVVAALVFSPALSPWTAVFGIQKALADGPQRADSIVIATDGVCVPAIVVNPPASETPAGADDEPAWVNDVRPGKISSRLWSEAQRREAGANAIGMETRVVVSGAPGGWRTLIARVDAAFEDAHGADIVAMSPARYTSAVQPLDAGAQLVSHYWLLNRETAMRLASQSVKLAVDYSMSLLQPLQTAELAVGAPRGYIAGFGYCSAQFDRVTSAIKVDCYKRGTRPAQFTANLSGASADLETSSGYPDYTPAAFELLSGYRHVVMLRNVPADRATRVTLASYEAVAHFNRVVTYDGLLGGSVAACPLPQAVE